MVFFMLTDIQQQTSLLICNGDHTGSLLQEAFGVTPEDDGTLLLPGIVSRKKQLVPAIMDALRMQ